MPIHAYRLVYPDSPQTPERLWEWDKVHIARLFWNATAFERELTHRYFLTWEDVAEENQRIWETYYQSHPLYEQWETWQAWLDEYRALVRDVQDMDEQHQVWRGKAVRESPSHIDNQEGHHTF